MKIIRPYKTSVAAPANGGSGVDFSWTYNSAKLSNLPASMRFEDTVFLLKGARTTVTYNGGAGYQWFFFIIDNDVAVASQTFFGTDAVNPITGAATVHYTACHMPAAGTVGGLSYVTVASGVYHAHQSIPYTNLIFPNGGVRLLCRDNAATTATDLQLYGYIVDNSYHEGSNA